MQNHNACSGKMAHIFQARPSSLHFPKFVVQTYKKKYDFKWSRSLSLSRFKKYLEGDRDYIQLVNS